MRRAFVRERRQNQGLRYTVLCFTVLHCAVLYCAILCSRPKSLDDVAAQTEVITALRGVLRRSGDVRESIRTCVSPTLA